LPLFVDYSPELSQIDALCALLATFVLNGTQLAEKHKF
jgi:hypothetical protein